MLHMIDGLCSNVVLGLADVSLEVRQFIIQALLKVLNNLQEQRKLKPGKGRLGRHSSLQLPPASEMTCAVTVGGVEVIVGMSSDVQCTQQLGMKSFCCVDAFIHLCHATLHNIQDHIFCLPTSNYRNVYVYAHWLLQLFHPHYSCVGVDEAAVSVFFRL